MDSESGHLEFHHEDLPLRSVEFLNTISGSNNANILVIAGVVKA
jgi:hypothetical protein